MKQKYTMEKLHPIRHMDRYVREVMAGSVSTDRIEDLKERFAGVKEIAYEMYKDSYDLIIKLEGEIPQNPEALWKHDLESVKLFYKSEGTFGNYSDEELHPIRHFEEYVEAINYGNLSKNRVVTLKERLGVVLRLSVRLYFDAERLIRLLD